ncbi:LDL receptor domain-containing protein [Nannocystis exedens]|uniref:LDL receptor domain-containing protein n=1 Tax=Nannocystis exedens TaxID=54 RepID=UPI000BBA0C26|nr:LDL receptor domain-containing protein [Nannocystis exedens]PCC68824.1 Low-density lipoprotein receptor domain class A [Nannocystis exedens]
MTLPPHSPAGLLGVLLALAPACNGAGNGEAATDAGTAATAAEPDTSAAATADPDPTTTATPTTGTSTADGTDTTDATGESTTAGTTGEGAGELLQKCMDTATLPAELNEARCQCNVNIGLYPDVATCLSFIPPDEALTPCGCELYSQVPEVEEFFDCMTQPYMQIVMCTADVVCAQDPAPLLACLQPFYEQTKDCPSLPMSTTAQVEIQCNMIEPFQCTSGEQIPETWQCNDIIDCMDASEEKGCPNSFGCADGSEYYPTNDVCDGYEDCRDGSDEADCP